MRQVMLMIASQSVVMLLRLALWQALARMKLTAKLNCARIGCSPCCGLSHIQLAHLARRLAHAKNPLRIQQT
jgi:hypothetical protein